MTRKSPATAATATTASGAPAPAAPAPPTALASALFGWLPSRGWSGGLLVLGFVLIGLGVVGDGHAKFWVERLPGFYGLFGFIAFFFVVLCGWPLGRLLRRSETYYRETDDA